MKIGKRFLAQLAQEVGEERARKIVEEMGDLIAPILRAGGATMTARLDEMTSDILGQVDAYDCSPRDVIVRVSTPNAGWESAYRRYLVPHDVILSDVDMTEWRAQEDRKKPR
jgi:hypothetical protein